MKNLKRALSLVLSAAMMVGMMVVGTGAAYADVTAEHNEEAIAVVAAAGIMGAGDSFNPDAELTRGEMAVIMVNMLDLDVKDFKGASNFTDAGWAVDYIDACYANGIMAGVSATEFGTNVKVTTAQAALMMLKALGYFEEAKLNDWMLDTIKMASKIDLLDGIDAKANANLTRNEVAQLALNALEATMVEETANGANTSIKGEGFEITVDTTVDRDDVDAKNKGQQNEVTYVIGAAADGKMQLIESLYGADIQKDVTANLATALGQPAYTWKDNTKKVADQEIIKVAEAPKYTVTVVDPNLANAHEVYKKYIDKNATVVADVFANNTIPTPVKVGANNTTFSVGNVVEFYTNSNGKIDAVTILEYNLGKIDKVDTNLTKADKEDGNVAKITVKDTAGNVTVNARLSKDFAGFDYAKDQYILYIENDAGNKVVASMPAVVVTGEVEKELASDKVVIGGETYKDLTQALTLGDKGSFYLDVAGQIKFADTTAAKSSDYAYIYAVETKTGFNAQGGRGTSYIAYMVLADGTKVSYTIDADAYDVNNANNPNAATFKTGAGEPVEVAGKTVYNFAGVVAYAINSDNELTFKVATNEIFKVTGAPNVSLNKDDAKIGTYYATADTEFVFVDDQGTKVKTSVTTGYKNVTITTADTFVITKDGKVLNAFVTAANGSLASDVVYAVRLDTEFSKVKVDTDVFTTINVSVDGADTTLTFKNTADNVIAQLSRGELFSYKMVDGYAVIENEVVVFAYGYSNDIDVVTDDYIVSAAFNGGNELSLTDDEIEYYTVTVEYENDTHTTIESVTVTGGVEMEKDDLVHIVMKNATDIAIVYILEIVD